MKKIFQKFLSIALAVCMVAAMMPKLTAYAETLNWKDNTDESWYTESASSYKIGTAQQLAGFDKLVNGGTTFAGKTVTLTADIDLAGRDWTPIGPTVDNRFQGTFDGQAHVISHLTIGSPDNPNPDLLYLGLFGYLSQTDNAVVRQVGIENVKIYSSCENADAGGLAGLVANTNRESKDLHLEKNYVTGGVYARGSGSCAGGLVGKIQISSNQGYLYFMNSYASCDVSAQLYAGGAIGYSAPNGANYTALMCNRDKEQMVAGNEVAAANRKLFGLDGSFAGALDETHCLTASEMKTDTFLCNSSMSNNNFNSINYGIYYDQIGFGLREGKNDGLPILKKLLRPLNVGDPFTGGDGYSYRATSVGDKKEATFTGGTGISGVFTIPSVTTYDDVPYHVTAVGNYALSGRTALTGLTIPSGITAIGDFAVQNCTKLESVSIADSVKSIGSQAFYNCGIKELQLGNGISQLGTWAFFGCKNLKSVALPDSLTTCGSSIFRECTALESINIPSGLTAINTEMLMNTSIESITLPENITSVGMYALSSCPKLKSITFLGNLQKIDQDAFSNDPLLKIIVFKSAVPPTTINSGGIFFKDTYPIYGQVPSGSVDAYQSAFSSAYYYSNQIKFGDQPLQFCVGETFSAQNNGTVISYKVTSVSPATVEVAASSPAYSGVVIIPETVKGSDGYTYQVTGIGSGAFSGCGGLTSVVLPSGVTTVGSLAFSDCAALTNLTFEGSAPQTVGNNLFQGDSVPLTVHIPANEKPNYEAAFTAYHDELTFVAATLPALSIPSGLSWDGTRAKWGTVTGASGYTVTLYKDSEAVVTKNVGADTASYNFENETSGNGNYTFTVTAQGNGSTSSDSAASEASTTYTGGPSISGTISMFSSLDNSVKTRSVAFGTAKSALNLPTSLSGKVNGSETSISGVTWSSNPAYDGSAAGTYTFTAVLPSGYTLSGSATLPTVTVTVKSQSGDNTGSSVSVSGFESLSSAVKNQTVAIGTAIASLNLPQKIKVVADGISDLWVRVSNWVCNISNSSIFSQTGTYTFIPMLDKTYHDSGYVDSGYTLANGVTPPNITVTVQGSSSNNHSKDTSSSSSSPATSPQTASTQVDTASNTATVTTVPDSITNISGTAQISVTVPSVTGGTGGSLDTGKAGKVTISLPESAIVQQLNAKQNVDLTLSVPSSVAQQTNSNTSVDIPVGSDVFAAAKAGKTDLVINIKDADTHKLAYTWTFKGVDLATSTTAVTDVNIGMAIRLTTEVPKVNQLTPNNTGLVLMFDHSGVLPSMASLTFSAKEKGFKPGQKLYFYFYNTSVGQLEPQVQEYTVDANGNVMVQISHCSNYVLLPNKARTITLDTRVYTMPVGSSYVTGVKLTGVSGAKLKTYSSTKGVADVRVLKNGNVMATGKKAGMTYVMIDVYDNKNKFLTHASVRLTVKEIVKPNGNSARQFGIF